MMILFKKTLVALSIIISIFFYLENLALAESWATMAPMKVGRYALSGGMINGKIFAVGGVVSRADCGGDYPLYTQVNESYDIATDTWSFIMSMPERRAYHVGATLHDRLYIIGGSIENDRVFTLTNSVIVYDPALDAWSTVASLSQPRHGISTVTFNGKIYAIGGYTSQGYSNLVEVYDPESDTWFMATPMPTSRIKPSVAVYEGKIYAIGGKVGPGRAYTNVNEVYDPMSDTWSQASPAPDKFGGAFTGVVANQIHIVGGGESTATTDEGIKHRVYDPPSDSWSEASPIPTRRWDGLSVVYNEVLHAIGGGNTTNPCASYMLATHEAYDPYDYVELPFDPTFPGNDCLKVNGRGVIPITIYGNELFDVTTLDVTTLKLNGISVRIVGKGKLKYFYEDVNVDGWQDLVCQFEDDGDSWTEGQLTALLEGVTSDGRILRTEIPICP